MSIPLPTIEEQNRIVAKIEAIESQIAELQKKIDAVPSLKKRILDKELLAE